MTPQSIMEKETEFAANAIQKAKEAAYEKALSLLNGKVSDAIKISEIAIKEVQENHLKGINNSLMWLNGYRRLSNRFFLDGLDGYVGVDAYIVIETHLIAYETFSMSMISQIFQYFIDCKYVIHNADDGTFILTDLGKEYMMEINKYIHIKP